jgi:hypothetical protein
VVAVEWLAPVDESFFPECSNAPVFHSTSPTMADRIIWQTFAFRVGSCLFDILFSYHQDENEDAAKFTVLPTHFSLQFRAFLLERSRLLIQLLRFVHQDFDSDKIKRRRKKKSQFDFE